MYHVPPLRPHSVDAVVSPLALHWVNDLPGCLRAFRRVLKPDGLFVGALFGGDSLQELRIALSVAEQEVRGGVSLRVSPMARMRDGGALLSRAGFALPAVDTDNFDLRFRTPMAVVRQLRALGETNGAGEGKYLPRAVWRRAEEIYRERFGTPSQDADPSSSSCSDRASSSSSSSLSSSVPLTVQVLYLTGWSPSPDQPTAARRGSATVSFQELSTRLTAEEDQGKHLPSGDDDGGYTPR
jgi:NADH dehydrogenase [ubiquinone] 1 alpha subcomplex assembly factor 5